MTTWTCGDCGAAYPLSVSYCTRPFDDYLALRGGSIESAMERALRPYILRLKQIEKRHAQGPAVERIIARWTEFQVAA